MAAASSSAGLPQRALALLDVALRVPCVFIIDSIFNSHSPTGPGPGGPGPGGPGPGGPGPGPAGWSGASGSGPVVVRVLGVLLSLVVLLLSQKALLRFYRLFLAVILAMAAILINYYATSHVDVSFSTATLAFQQRSSAPWLWLAVVAVQLLLALGYVFLLELRWLPAALVVLDVLVPLWGLMVQLPPDLRRLVAGCCGGALAVNTGAVLAARLRWFYYSCRYVYLLLRHMYRIYGLQLLLEDTWRRIRLPHVLRLFWLTRLAAQALILLYVVRAVRRESGHATGGTATDGGSASQAFLPPWDVLWDLCSNLIISGCDSTLTVLGMSSVISSLAHYLGLSILLFIGSTEEEDKRLGFVAPVLFFILALQTGLSSLDPEERLVRLSRNLCLLLTAVLHFIHGMTDPVLMSLSASQVWSLRRHLPVLLVSLSLFLLPVALTHFLWRHYVLNTWLFAVSAFCVELCLKVLVSLTVYGLFLCDGVSGSLWEGLDDYVYYVRSGGSVMEFLFGVLMFGNGAYTMMFESGSKIRACMMLLHAYFNIYLQARSGWRTFTARRAAVARINSLPEAQGEALRRLQDVCAICYQEFSSSARVTPCHHYFHALCLRKWLYIQDTCPMCHQRVYVEDDAPNADPASNNNMAAAAAEAPPPAEPAPPPGEDNDSIEYDEDEWEEPQTGDTPLEEDYINDQDTEDTED